LFWAGEEILALAADTEEHALDAVRAIKIEYQELPHLVKEEDALQNDPQTVSAMGGKRNNVLAVKEAASENFEMSMTGSAVTAEGRYGVAHRFPQRLESHRPLCTWGQAC